MSGWPGTSVQRAVKRTVDVALAGTGLLVCGPVLIGLALAVRLTSPGGAIFRQHRAGRDGRTFTLHKLRTMTVDAPAVDPAERVARDLARITPVGRWLRRTSLDELPQLVDVLRGELSLVGPRPDLPHHIERYSERQRRRLVMRPGLTGWAQIQGRNELSWEERIELDVEYVEKWSLVLDALILLRTPRVVLSGRGTGLHGEARTTR